MPFDEDAEEEPFLGDEVRGRAEAEEMEREGWMKPPMPRLCPPDDDNDDEWRDEAAVKPPEVSWEREPSIGGSLN